MSEITNKEQIDLFNRLFECKREIGKISKDSTNPFYKSKYFDINQLLNHVEPILEKHGLLLLQPIDENKISSIIISKDSGASTSSTISLNQESDPQKKGSEITYFRRYTLQSLLALQAEDDDGNNASTAKGSTNGSDSSGNPTIWLNKTLSKNSSELSREWINILDAIEKGEIKSLQDIRKHYKVNRDLTNELETLINK